MRSILSNLSAALEVVQQVESSVTGAAHDESLSDADDSLAGLIERAAFLSETLLRSANGVFHGIGK